MEWPLQKVLEFLSSIDWIITAILTFVGTYYIFSKGRNDDKEERQRELLETLVEKVNNYTSSVILLQNLFLVILDLAVSLDKNFTDETHNTFETKYKEFYRTLNQGNDQISEIVEVQLKLTLNNYSELVELVKEFNDSSAQLIHYMASFFKDDISIDEVPNAKARLSEFESIEQSVGKIIAKTKELYPK